MATLLDRLASWKPFTAVVLGDFMLDQLQFGDADRLSGDAPVPVLRVRRTEDRPGGAANVALDLAAMQGRVGAVGVVGDDAEGRRLRGLLEEAGVDAGGLVVDPSRPTTVKRNLIGLAQHRHPQKMFRVDFESREPLSPELSRRVLASLRERLVRADALVIEDYDKGVCHGEIPREAIRLAREAGKPIFVDPAAIEDYAARYRGCTAMTPNRTEAQRATGERAPEGPGESAALVRMAHRLLESLGMEAVVLTLDRHGALLLEAGGEPLAAPTVARQVYDVSGAGDMFLAGVTAARCNGCSWHDAVRFANAAAGLEVEILGVEPIPLDRIHRWVRALETGQPEKVRTREQAASEAQGLRKGGRRVVFTNGCFDVLHAGHVSLLQQARREGDFLIVGLNDDASVRRLKGPLRPVNPQADRARVLASLACVDAVVLFAEDTPEELIRAVRPDVLVKGADYDKSRVVGASIVESYGGRVVLAELVPGRSTTETIRRLGGAT